MFHFLARISFCSLSSKREIHTARYSLILLVSAQLLLSLGERCQSKLFMLSTLTRIACHTIEDTYLDYSCKGHECIFLQDLLLLPTKIRIWNLGTKNIQTFFFFTSQTSSKIKCCMLICSSSSFLVLLRLKGLAAQIMLYWHTRALHPNKDVSFARLIGCLLTIPFSIKAEMFPYIVCCSN